MAFVDVPGIRDTGGTQVDPRQEDGHGSQPTDPTYVDKNRFASLLKFEPQVGEEIRRDETSTDDYHGRAPDGTAENSPVWEIVRFYKTNDLIVRVRYRTGVRWDQRTVGWT